MAWNLEDSNLETVLINTHLQNKPQPVFSVVDSASLHPSTLLWGRALLQTLHSIINIPEALFPSSSSDDEDVYRYWEHSYHCCDDHHCWGQINRPDSAAGTCTCHVHQKEYIHYINGSMNFSHSYLSVDCAEFEGSHKSIIDWEISMHQFLVYRGI